MTFKKIQLVEHRQQQYLADSRQFAKSSAIPTEKQQGIAIIAALEKDVSDFEARVNRFFRHVATSNIQPDISATQGVATRRVSKVKYCSFKNLSRIPRFNKLESFDL